MYPGKSFAVVTPFGTPVIPLLDRCDPYPGTRLALSTRADRYDVRAGDASLPRSLASIDTLAVKSWAATQLEPRRERVVQYFLEQAGFEVYLPRIHQRRVRVEVLTPLFPNYCFTRIELQWHSVRQCPGVIRLVKSGEEPAHVSDEIIAAIRRRERNGAIDLPKNGPRTPRTGDRVQIISGLFAGRFGLCAQISREHIGVLLHMLGAQRQIRLRRDAVEPV